MRGSAPDSRELGLRAHQLAVARRNRFLRSGDPDDLTAATAAHRTALGCPVAESERRVLLDSWGNTLRTRFDATGDVDDLRTAIAAYDEALTPGGAAPDHAARLMNLGAALAAGGADHLAGARGGGRGTSC